MAAQRRAFQEAISLDEAISLIRAAVQAGRTEQVPLNDVCGRVLASDIVSDIDIEPFDSSAMDGFAVVDSDLAQASESTPVQLRCVAHIGAGSVFPSPLTSGFCVRIMTGAPIPSGATAVVRMEDARFANGGEVGDAIEFRAPIASGANIHRAARDARAGQVVLPAGTIVRPSSAGLIATCGYSQVSAFARPVVGIITIGSELVPSDCSLPLPPGKIRDSNRWGMCAFAQQAGGIPRLYACVPDDADAIQKEYRRAVAECDLVLSTGGACLGDFDLTPGIVGELGELVFSNVNLRPGGSQSFGVIDGKPVFVLSGNPGSSSLGFDLFVRPALLLLQGRRAFDRLRVKAHLRAELQKRDPRLSLERAVLRHDDDGELRVEPCHNFTPSLFQSLQNANCLIALEPGRYTLPAGSLVDCIVLDVDEAQ